MAWSAALARATGGRGEAEKAKSTWLFSTQLNFNEREEGFPSSPKSLALYAQEDLYFLDDNNKSYYHCFLLSDYERGKPFPY